MKFDLYKKDGEFRIDCDDLGISLSAATLSRLLLEFQDDLEFINEEYGQCKSTDIMSMDALVLRDKIQELMGDEK